MYIEPTIVVAYNRKFIIGNNQGLPWHIPEDLKLFKELTTGHICIMGRKTFDLLPEKYKPLPGRFNFVVSRSGKGEHQEGEPFWHKPLVHNFPSVDAAIRQAWHVWPRTKVFITGGAQIYRYCLDNHICRRVLASEIRNHLEVEGTATFPDLSKQSCWTRKLLKEYKDFDFVEYTLSAEVVNAID